MKVLILGKGFLGTFISNYLKCDVISRAEIDYLDYNIFENYIAGFNLDSHNSLTIINCSGYTGNPNVDACEDNKESCFIYNALNPATIESHCKKIEVVFRIKINYIHISSGCIFNGYDKAYTEYSKPNFGMWNSESSCYSKTKHIGELNLDKDYTAILRIRMPFCGFYTNKNLLLKLLKYNNLISKNNSLTCVEDLAEFIRKFSIKFNPGIYNVVNPGYIAAKEITDLMLHHGQSYLTNKFWNVIEENSLSLKAKRSNCILSSEKLEYLELALPPVRDSLIKQIEQLSKNWLTNVK